MRKNYCIMFHCVLEVHSVVKTKKGIQRYFNLKQYILFTVSRTLGPQKGI